jgi:hypothetical protein
MSFFSLIMVGLLAIGLLTWATPAASADTPGVWKLTGSMATSRRHSAMGRLSDGRIIVVGGTDTTGVDGAAKTFYSTAEIYNPATGTWTSTGSLKTGPRALHTITLMYGGKSLVTGGWNGKAALSSAEIYNLKTGTFSATGSMKHVHAEHSAIDLFDGRVLITGGFDSSGNPIASAEIYDPATGIFSDTKWGPMASARSGHRMNTVGDGKVLITGGFGAGGAPLPTAELFDPKTERFTTLGASLEHARANHSATELPTGEILVAGGYGEGGVLSSTEIYDPDSKTFSAGPTLEDARQSHSARVLPNGLLLISGGNNNPFDDWDIQTSFLSSAEIYNPATNGFTTIGSKNNATSGANSYLLWTGKMLVAGGGTNQAELYTPQMPGTAETWVAAADSMNTPRASAPHSYLDDGSVIMIGGLDSSGNPMASAEVYDYLTGDFASTGSMWYKRQHHSSTRLYTGKVLVAGGRPSASANVLNTAELYDPLSGTFSLTGNMLKFRRLHRATALPDGRVLITSGLGGDSNTANGFLSGAEIYDPATGTFTGAGDLMNTARYNHLAILLYTGKVLIAGGVGKGSPSNIVLNSAELYDPETGTFTATGNMTTPRNNALATTLPNGKVLISNGSSDIEGTTPIQAIEIYDPATGKFTAAGNALVARYNNRIVRLGNGKTIFVGGQTTADTSSVSNTAELYNHVTGTFSATGSLGTGRRNFAQWSLPNGRVLVAGGYDKDGTALSSAELYTPLIADEVDTTITSGPTSPTSSTSATFTFTSTPIDSTFHCSLDASPFVACASGKTYSSLADGSHVFQVQAIDSLGNTDPTPATYEWTVDTSAPVVTSFKINAGAATTANGSVTLNNTATKLPTHYMASESDTFAGAIWQKYSTAPSLALSSGRGEKRVYFKVKNAFHESAYIEDKIEALAPTVTFKINARAASTANSVVTLNNVATNSPTHYKAASTSQDLVGASWQPYSKAPKFTLSGGAGQKWVFFKVKNSIDESPEASDDILALGPTVTFKINAGAASTANSVVTLNNVATNSPTHYKAASTSQDLVGASWQPYSKAPKFILSDGAGQKWVFFKVKNSIDESPEASDDISAAGSAPVVSLKINAGAASTANSVVTLNNVATSSPTHYKAASTSQDLVGASWQPYSTAPKFTLSGGAEKKWVYFKVKNIFGESPEASDDILALGPTVSLKINAGAASTANSVVTLNNVATNSPTHYKAASTSQDLVGASWQPYSKAPKFILSGGAGQKWVFFKVKNSIDESSEASDDISAAGSAPVVTSFKINAGAASTANALVTLNNAGTNSPTYYMASESPTFVGAVWQPYSTVPKFTLSAGSGTKTVYLKTMSIFGESYVVSDTIFLY